MAKHCWFINKASGHSSQGTEDEDDGRGTSSVILMVKFSTGFASRGWNYFGIWIKRKQKCNLIQALFRCWRCLQRISTSKSFWCCKFNFKLLSLNSATPLSLLKAGKGKPQVQLIKQKLKGMTSILGKCNGKINTEEKLELESAIKGLLEKVRTVTSTNPLESLHTRMWSLLLQLDIFISFLMK